jgi:hypothetical protein
MSAPISLLELCCNTHLTAFYYHRIPMSLNFTARFSRSRLHNSLHIILAALVPLHLHPSGHSHTGPRPLRTWLTWLLLGKFLWLIRPLSRFLCCVHLGISRKGFRRLTDGYLIITNLETKFTFLVSIIYPNLELHPDVLVRFLAWSIPSARARRDDQ